MPLDIETIRKDYPILNREIYGKPLVYLDNTATTQTPARWLRPSRICISATKPMCTAVSITSLRKPP